MRKEIACVILILLAACVNKLDSLYRRLPLQLLSDVRTV